ncbi:type II secretion system F family protein [Actinomadura sp. 6N118]|uniref:type II secretion system F family protein n=1 Tax=Actinomadura sp. 6N118 TaxID=3375151 RepID=UPI003794F866
MTLTVIAGALIGLGLFILIAELRPAPPRLDAALTQLDAHEPDPDTPATPSTPLQVAAGRLAARLTGPGGLPIPRKDLAILGQTSERFVLNKIGCLLLGLALPAMLPMLAFAAGAQMPVPIEVPAIASLVLAAALFFAPDMAVRVDAAERRTDFRRLLTAYLDQVTLERAAGAAPNQALETAAEISDAWVFQRINTVLQRARRAQQPPWEGLAALGAEIDVVELEDLAQMAQLAAGEGTKILETLRAKADSMRQQQLSDARTAANSHTTTMVIPIALLGMGFLLLLAFPVMYTMVNP